MVHLGAKRCLYILEVVLYDASDALAATIAAGEAGADELACRRACAMTLKGRLPEPFRCSNESNKLPFKSKLSELREQLQLVSDDASGGEKKELDVLWAILKDAEALSCVRRSRLNRGSLTPNLGGTKWTFSTHAC